MKKYVVRIEKSKAEDRLVDYDEVQYSEYDTWREALVKYRYFKRIYDKEQLYYYKTKSFWITLEIQEQDEDGYCDNPKVIYFCKIK